MLLSSDVSTHVGGFTSCCSHIPQCTTVDVKPVLSELHNSSHRGTEGTIHSHPVRAGKRDICSPTFIQSSSADAYVMSVKIRSSTSLLQGGNPQPRAIVHTRGSLAASSRGPAQPPCKRSAAQSHHVVVACGTSNPGHTQAQVDWCPHTITPILQPYSDPSLCLWHDDVESF